MSINIPEANDTTYCQTIAKSISEILRFSLDEEFRKSTFDLFGVSCANDIENEINKRLLLIIQNQNSTHLNKKDKENSQEGTDIENIQEPENTLDEVSVASGTNSDSQSLSESMFQRNWLQISTQQYRAVVKRRKLNYFSQPQYQHWDFELNNFSNSQPTSSTSEETNTHRRLLSGEENYCQKMFSDSLEENSRKCLRRNTKLGRYSSF